MRAFEIRSFGLDGLLPAELPDPPAPAAKDVLVRVRAASLNYRDLMMVRGQYNPKQPLPLIPLSDGAGEVVTVGADVTRAKVGDRVMGSFTQGWQSGKFNPEYWAKTTLGGPLPGMLAEYNTLRETGIVRIPDFMTYEEAASLPCAAVTAWNALMTPGDLKPGQTVLVQGTGGVSLFALQFARAAGARVIATSSSDEKLARALALGANDGINYKNTPDWEVRVRELTDGVGVDHVIEVGGPGTLPRSMKAVRAGGRISLIGVLTAGEDNNITPLPILFNALNITGILVGNREMFEQMCAAMALHQIHPVIDRVFPFDEARAAFDHLAGATHFGKIVIRI